MHARMFVHVCACSCTSWARVPWFNLSFYLNLLWSIALQAREELAKLGPMSTDEKLTAFAFAVTVGLWIFGGAIGVNAVAAALTGLAILLITGALAQ